MSISEPERGVKSCGSPPGQRQCPGFGVLFAAKEALQEIEILHACKLLFN